MFERTGHRVQWAEITYRGGVPEVETAWVAEHFDEVRVVDVRQHAELHGPLSHIEGIEHVPLDRLLAAASSWDTDEKIVVLCRSGGRSGRAAQALEQRGFQRVASMAGGMLKWNDEGRPTR